jgi:hypothetical protein
VVKKAESSGAASRRHPEDSAASMSRSLKVYRIGIN